MASISEVDNKAYLHLAEVEHTLEAGNTGPLQWVAVEGSICSELAELGYYSHSGLVWAEGSAGMMCA